MKKLLSFVLALALMLSLSSHVFATSTPPGLKRLGTADMQKICQIMNEKNDNFLCEYDEKEKALIMTYVYEEKADAEKSLTAIVKNAENGDETAKNRLVLMEMIFENQIDSTMDLFYQQGWYTDIVLRCVDPLYDNALVIEYVNGIRTSFMPQ